MALTLTWHGHSCYSLQTGNANIVIDPFLAPDNPAAKKHADDVEADVILLTHGHFDHVADAVSIARRTGAKIIANFEIIQWLEAKGLSNLHAQHIGGGFQHDFGHVKLTPALHGSMLPDGSNGGMPNGFLLTLSGKRLYFAGDTALFGDMKLIGRQPIDLAVLPIGDNFTMGPEDALEAVTFLTPKVVVPAHYNTWAVVEQDAPGWADEVEKTTGAKAVVLGVEESYNFQV